MEYAVANELRILIDFYNANYVSDEFNLSINFVAVAFLVAFVSLVAFFVHVDVSKTV